MYNDIELDDFVTDPRSGDPAFWRIINQAEGTFDVNPAYVLEGIHQGMDDLGRGPRPVITLLVLRTRLDGSTYLKRQNVDPRSVFARAIQVEELDGTATAPKSLGDLIAEWKADRREFLKSLPTMGGTVVSAAEVAAAATE